MKTIYPRVIKEVGAAPDKSRPFIILLFLLALVVRLAYLIFLKKYYFFADHPGSDVAYYDQWAVDIIKDGPLNRQVFWGLPLYPYFLAVLKVLTFGNELLAHLTQLLMGSLNCVLTYGLARKMFSDRTAQLAGLLTALNFPLIHYDWLMMPVTVLITLSLLIVGFLADTSNVSGRRQCFILGILIGLAMLGDGKFLIFFPLAAGYLLSLNNRKASSFLSGSLLPLALGVLIVVGAVGVRNKVVGGVWVPISAQSGLSFYSGNNPEATGIFEVPQGMRPTHEGQDIDQRIIAERHTGRPLDAGEVSNFWRGEGMSFIFSSPVKYLHLLFQKFKIFFTDHEGAYDLDLLFQENWKDRLDGNFYSLITALALIGIFLARNAGKPAILSALMILSQLIFTLIFFLNDRHRATILPFLIIFESYAIIWLIGEVRQRRFAVLLMTVTSVIAFLLLFPPVRLSRATIDFLKNSKAGPVFEKKGAYKDARAAYLKALETDPWDPVTLSNLANVCLLDGDYADAELYYKKALAVFPDFIDALYNLGVTQEKEGNIDQAIAQFEHLIELDPQSYDAHFNLGRIYAQKGQCDKAKPHFRDTIRLNPQFTKLVSPYLASCGSP